jgi:hypothetical protein
MTNTVQNNSQSYSSVQQMLSVFEQIDTKICSLHECSSDDFAIFSARLKDFNTQVKEISSNANTILNIIDSDNIGNTFTQLNFYHYQIKTYVEEFEKQINTTINDLEEMIREINSLYLPLKNYKQNLLTFKYLVANLKLNIAYVAPQQNTLYDNEIEHINSKIDEAHAVYPNLEEGLEIIKTFIFDMLSHFKQLREQNNKRTSLILYQSDYSLNFLNAKHAEIISQIIALRSKTNNCYECVSQIITNLQFQDIIRQKIEHIQSIQKSLLEEIILVSNNNSNKINKSIALQIKDMAELQSAQLTHTNKEYQKAIEIIIKQFLDISDNMSFVLDTGANVSGVTEIGETPFSEVEKELNDSVMTLQDLLDSINTFYIEAPVISDAVGGIKSIFRGLFVLNGEFEILIERLIDKFNENNNNDEGKKMIRHLRDGSGFTKHIQTLKVIVKQLIKNSNELEATIAQKQSEQTINSKLSEIKQQSGTMIAEITKANKEIVQIMDTNSSLSLHISENIKTSIKQVKYYDFFDKSIEEIIGLLQQVYYWLSTTEIDTEETSNHAHSDRLEELKKQYTMESERLIHQSVLQGETVNEISDANTNADEDDLELF